MAQAVRNIKAEGWGNIGQGASPVSCKYDGRLYRRTFLFLSSLTGLGTHRRTNPGNKLPGYCLSSLPGLSGSKTGTVRGLENK